MPGSSENDVWIEIVLTAPPELSDALENFLYELGTQGVSQEETLDSSFDSGNQNSVEIKAYLPETGDTKENLGLLNRYMDSLAELFPDLDRPAVTTNRIVDPDWGEQWKKYFKPLRISNDIVIKPTWERYAPLGRDIVIDIDPGMAFGTGQHPSTRMCITTMEELLRTAKDLDTWKALDVGTGTGILAICCAKLGIGKVVALDLDPKAVEIAGKNIVINRVDDKVEILNRDVSMHTGEFDFIVANLTANALIHLRPHIGRMIKPGGFLILSGIMDQDGANVVTIYNTEDISLAGTRAEKEWVCYVFTRRSKKQ
ncbi:MAG: 50S ribosomal protein L11 methyltransferase [Deltaproteobacteria bacterium]|nr:50S ribosomal protein L11 methyltransferase [Deltaproteobacteria bacterium]MBN2688752.1 50S ribosomal protein L11 methyltransferase [Deltaproteobacteria bacterium]